MWYLSFAASNIFEEDCDDSIQDPDFYPDFSEDSNSGMANKFISRNDNNG